MIITDGNVLLAEHNAEAERYTKTQEEKKWQKTLM